MLYPMPLRTSSLVRMPARNHLRLVDARIERVPVDSGAPRRLSRRRPIGIRRVVEAACTFATVLFLAAVFGSVAFLTKNELAGLVSPPASASASHYIKLTVACGDSLWAIAGRYGSADVDKQSTIAGIAAANPKLDIDSPLKPGTVLLIPAGR